MSRPTSRAALAVRTLARVAAFMPKNPASIEQRPPLMKASAVRGVMNSASRMATTSTNHTRTEYSLRRKAMAPVWIWLAMSTMTAVPLGCATT